MQYPSRKVLEKAIHLQHVERRWHNGIPELMRFAIESDSGDASHFPIALCRMLFVPNGPKPLRSPLLGLPGFIGDTSAADWPLEPIHLHRGIPFFIVDRRTMAGLPESPAQYLAYCLKNGSWNESPYEMRSDDEYTQITDDFVANGPWKRELDSTEVEFLRQQTS